VCLGLHGKEYWGRQAATITPAGLLSGTPKKQQVKGAKGGLLQQIGDFGIIVLKDFGSVWSMRADNKAETLAALREVFDGSWTRHLGTDGGKTLSWQGKVGLIFGATGVIDAHYSVIGAMGDRFLLSRLAYERVAMLIASVIKRDTKPLTTSVALLKLVMTMSEGFGTENRARLVAYLRAAADSFEGPARPGCDEQMLLH
jgi:hypothetical protein